MNSFTMKLLKTFGKPYVFLCTEPYVFLCTAFPCPCGLPRISLYRTFQTGKQKVGLAAMTWANMFYPTVFSCVFQLL